MAADRKPGWVKVYQHGSHVSGDNQAKSPSTSGFNPQSRTKVTAENMTSERVSVQSGEDEGDTMGYYDEEDDLEAFSDGELGCEDGGRQTFFLLRKVTAVESEVRRYTSALPGFLLKRLNAV